MAGPFNQVDLSQLPAPAVVDPLSFELIRDAMRADLIARHPEFSALVESDPAFKIIDVAAWRELLIRNRINEAAKAVMLPTATGADLDNLAANFGLARLLITPENNDVIPPQPAIYESDAEFRLRCTLSLEGYSTAGSEGGYVFNALSASGLVKDVSATSPEPGKVVVYILSRETGGTASVDLINVVKAALNADSVRPITDQVTVLSASIVEYEIVAELTTYPGPDAEVVRAAAQAAITDHVASLHRLGHDVNLSGIYAALHQAGVQNVNLISPDEDLEIDASEASLCTSITISLAGVADG